MEEIDMSTVEGFTDSSLKKRPRKKHLYSQILQQMEFYFSDANLTKDRFLKQLIQKSKNVPLETFLRFNKIRALSSSIEEIAKALGTSQLLKVTEDGKNVYRTTPVKQKQNEDDCIIYVEQLPPDANHEWVKGIFSSYGKVEYVSIPKYKNRAAIKGFAFVEFDTPEAAKNALEAFGSAGCCLPPQIPPEELCSIATFETEPEEDSSVMIGQEAGEKKAKKHKKINRENRDDSEQMQGQTFEDEEIDEPKFKKLKSGIDDSIMEEKPKKKKKKDKSDKDDDLGEASEVHISENEAVKSKKGKKRKLENEDIESESNVKSIITEEGNVNGDGTVSKKKKKKNLIEEEDVRGQLSVELAEEGGTHTTGKKKKKHKHLNQDGSGNTKDETEEMEETNEGVQVVKKKKKNNENEDDGHEIKEDAEDEGFSKRAIKQTDEGVDDNDSEEEAGVDSENSSKKKRSRKRNKNKKKSIEKKENDPVSLGLRIISKNEWRRLRNKYLNLQREKMQSLKKHLARGKFGSNYQSPFYSAKENGSQEIKQEPVPPSTTYIPGVIVHVDLGEPLGDVDSFKINVRNEPGVQYVDINKGDSEAHIRCISAEAAENLLSKNQWDNMELLQGDAEKKYWEKIKSDRESKKNNKVRVSRGRNKLLKRAERELGKHIKFDD